VEWEATAKYPKYANPELRKEWWSDGVVGVVGCVRNKNHLDSGIFSKTIAVTPRQDATNWFAR
jgi:hypothetical protein